MRSCTSRSATNAGPPGGEPEPFASARLRHDEGVDADQFAGDVHQRPAAVARVDRRVGLDINQWIVGLRLPGNRTHDSHAHRVLHAARTAEREHQLALLHRVVVPDRQGRQAGSIDFQQREIELARHTDQGGGDQFAPANRQRPPGALAGRRRRQQHINPLGAADDMGIGDDIAAGVDDHPGADVVLAIDRGLRGIGVGWHGGEARYPHLHHAGRHLGDQRLDRTAQAGQVVEAALRSAGRRRARQGRQQQHYDAEAASQALPSFP
jgi:hypothetical protein